MALIDGVPGRRAMGMRMGMDPLRMMPMMSGVALHALTGSGTVLPVSVMVLMRMPVSLMALVAMTVPLMTLMAMSVMAMR